MFHSIPKMARSKESPDDDRDEMPVTELIISNGSKGQWIDTQTVPGRQFDSNYIREQCRRQGPL